MGVNPGRPTNEPLNYFAIGKQSAKGAVAANFYFLKHLDGSGFEVDREITREREGGDGQEVGFSYVNMIKADGAMNANARPNITARIFVGVLGAVTQGSAAVASLGRFTIVPAATLPYYTMEQRWADEIERSHDNVITQATFEGEAGKPWKLSAQFLSGATITQRDVASALTVTRDVGRPFFYPGGSYIFDSGASYANDVTKIKAEINRGVDDGIQTTSLGRDDIVPLNFDATIDATIKYVSRDFYQKVTYSGGSNILSDIPTGSIDLQMLQNVAVNGSVFASGMLRVLFPLIEWTDAKPNKLDPDGKTTYLDLVGMTVKGATHSVNVIIDTAEITNPY